MKKLNVKKLKNIIFIFKELLTSNGISELIVLIASIFLFLLEYNSFGSFMLGLLVCHNQMVCKSLLRKTRISKSRRRKK